MSELFVGKPAPDFTLPDQNGKEVKLSDFKGKQNVVLLFYPLDWTPVWSSELPGCEELGPDLAKLDTQVLGISVDSTASHKAFAEKLGVSFPLLSDMHRRVSRMYGILIEEQGIAARATFLLDKDGIVRYQLVNDLDIRCDEQELLRVVKAMTELKKK